MKLIKKENPLNPIKYY